MKHLFIACSFFFTINLYAQQVPEKANTFVITFADSTNLATKVTKAFEQNEYPVKNPKKSTVRIASDPKTLKTNTRVALLGEIKGTVVSLTARLVYTGQDAVKVEFNEKKGTPVMMAWEEMEKVAKSLGGKVSYERR